MFKVSSEFCAHRIIIESVERETPSQYYWTIVKRAREREKSKKKKKDQCLLDDFLCSPLFFSLYTFQS